MKLTWFGGTALRIHIGGKMLVCAPQTAARDVNQAELTSGADTVLQINFGAGSADPVAWHPRRPVALIDETEAPDVLVQDFGLGAAVVDAVGEPPLAIYGRGLLFSGSWKTDAVVVAFNAFDAIHALADMHPRILALAFDDDLSLEPALETLGKDAGRTSIFALERGQALEV